MRTGMLILLAGIILASCSSKKALPDGVLKPAKMQAVLWDIIRVDAFTTNFIKKDSSKNAVTENAKLQKRKDLFEKLGILSLSCFGAVGIAFLFFQVICLSLA